MIENPEIIKLREKPNKSKAHNRSMHQFEIAKKKKRERKSLHYFLSRLRRRALPWENRTQLFTLLISLLTLLITYTHAGTESKTWNLCLFISLSFTTQFLSLCLWFFRAPILALSFVLRVCFEFYRGKEWSVDNLYLRWPVLVWESGIFLFLGKNLVHEYIGKWNPMDWSKLLLFLNSTFIKREILNLISLANSTSSPNGVHTWRGNIGVVIGS